MTVGIQYAQNHLKELIDAVDGGEQVTIERESGRNLLLVTKEALLAPTREQVPEIFWANLKPFQGIGRLGEMNGTVTMPTDEEWQAMDEEIERDFEDSCIFPDGSDA